MKTVIVTDKITSFKRDQKGMMLRLHSQIRTKNWISKTFHKEVDNIKDLYNRIIQGQFSSYERVYLCIGYVEPILKKDQINLTINRLQYIFDYFSENNVQIFIFEPILRIKLTKQQKIYFKSIHYFINTKKDEDDVEILKSPLCGKDPLNPNIESIKGFVTALATSIQVRKIVQSPLKIVSKKQVTKKSDQIKVDQIKVDMVQSKTSNIPVTVIRTSRKSVRKNAIKNKRVEVPKQQPKPKKLEPLRISITEEAPKRTRVK